MKEECPPPSQPKKETLEEATENLTVAHFLADTIQYWFYGRIQPQLEKTPTADFLVPLLFSSTLTKKNINQNKYKKKNPTVRGFRWPRDPTYQGQRRVREEENDVKPQH